jgi:hypothetical protein
MVEGASAVVFLWFDFSVENIQSVRLLDTRERTINKNGLKYPALYNNSPFSQELYSIPLPFFPKLRDWAGKDLKTWRFEFGPLLQSRDSPDGIIAAEINE